MFEELTLSIESEINEMRNLMRVIPEATGIGWKEVHAGILYRYIPVYIFLDTESSCISVCCCVFVCACIYLLQVNLLNASISEIEARLVVYIIIV